MGTAPRHDAVVRPRRPRSSGLCRDLIRIDTSNYGDATGPGERKAAEHVAALLDEVGIASRGVRVRARPHVPGRPLGRVDAGDALLLHGHLDVVPAAAEDWQVDPFSGEVQDGYVWGRGAVDMKDFDAMLLSVVRARARAGRGARPPHRALLHRRRGGRRGARRPAAGRAAPRPVRGLHRGGRRGGRVQRRPSAAAGSTSSRAAEKGMAWLRLTARGRAGHGSMINRDNAVTELAAAVARIGAPRVAGAAHARRWRCCWRPWPSWPAPRRPPRTPRRWSRSSAARPGCSARSSATPPTRRCSAPATRST